MRFTQDEIDALLFYQGSIEKVSEDKRVMLQKFYSVDSAYNVLNVLLFPGIGNEMARIAEGKELDQELIAQMKELIKIYCNIYSAMCKYTFLYENGENFVLYTKRADRAYSVKAYEKGESFTFLSTTSKDQVDKYFCEKEGLILLEVESTAQIEHIDLNKILGNNSDYQGEREILFAPFLHVNLEKTELDKSEESLKDCNGNPPLGKYKLMIMDSLIEMKSRHRFANEKSIESELYLEVTDKEALNNVINVWSDLKEGKGLNPDKEKKYIEWKEKLRTYLKKRYEYIKGDVLEMINNETLNRLLDDISGYKNWTNEKRVEYDKKLTRFNIALSIMQPLVAVAMALSFIENIEVAAKVIGILLTGVCMTIYKLCEALGLKGKVEQRTITYLRLDELEREICYESSIDKEKEKRFVEQFKAIIINDNRKCESNIQNEIRNLRDLGTSNHLKGGI